MKRTIIIISAFTLLFNFGCKNKSDMPKPPDLEKIKKVFKEHGNERIDNYYWLNERDNPKVINYLKGENAYLKKVLKHTEKLQDSLFKEIVGRIKQTDMSVPYKHNGYFYFTRYEEGKEYPVYSRKKGNLDAQEEVMLNANKSAEGMKYYMAVGLKVSPNNKILAYGEDTLGRRKYTIKFKNLETGKFYKDQIPVTAGMIAWANDNQTIFYTIKDESLRPYKILKHKLGSDVKNDKVVFHEDDATYTTGCFRTKSGDYIMIHSASTLSDEYRFLDANKPNGDFKVVQARERGLEYNVDHFKDKFYIRTNLDAQNFRLMEAPVGNPGIENWKEIIPHRKQVLLEDIEIFKQYLVTEERKDGLMQLRIIPWNNWDNDHYIHFDEEAYTSYIGTNMEFDTEVLRFGYTSMAIPNSVYDYNMKTKEKTLMKRQEVLGGYDPGNYHSERLWATADDGSRIPISMVYKKGIEKNGQNPLLLYAYGSYGSSLDPYFSVSRVSLLDRGFIFAIPHVRGGEEMGRQWYEQGKLLHKKNTFTDFNDCAEFLIEKKYTNPDKLFAMGGSAGGLLMGVIANMKPELYTGIIAQVPFVDVITTMMDESIPLTTGEFDEWGNPKNKKFYDYILSYSPYDNVSEQKYPNMLISTGLHDSQVQYWEPAKWVAKLRDMKTDNNLLLLHTNMSAGHGGASGRFEQFKETALEYAFMIDLVR